MKRLKNWLYLAALLLIGVALYAWVSRQGSSAKISYRTEPLRVGNVSMKVTATGSLQAVTRISVGSEVSGRVIRLFVDYNSKVRKGQLLAQLDPSIFQAQLEQQQAGLSDAQGAYDNAQAGQANAAITIEKSEASILGAQAQVDGARASLSNSRSALLSAGANTQKAVAQLDNSQLNSQRQELLSQRDLIARSDYDTARSTYLQDRANLQSVQNQAESARANLRSAESTLAARQADLGVARSTRDGAVAQWTAAQAQVRSAAARVRQAQANLDQARYNLDRTDLRAPIDGIVLDRKVTIGQTVAAQFQAPDLFTLAENLNQMQVEVAVDEADIGQVKVGAAATFTVDSFPEETFKGTVREVRQAPVTVQNVVTYTVVIRTGNPKLQLMPGMTATVGIRVATRQQALLVANGALRFKAPTPLPEPALYTLEDGQLKPHRVKLGISDGLQTEVLNSDLKEGDQVVVEAAGSAGSSSTRSGTNTSRPAARLF